MKFYPLLCCGEQMSCFNYVPGQRVRFRQMELLPGEILEERSRNGVYMVFVLEGCLKICCPEKREEEMTEGEMAILDSTWGCRAECVEKARVITFVSEHPREFSDRLVSEIAAACERIKPCFNKLMMGEVFLKFLELVRVCLKEGIDCLHWQEEKQEEMFILLDRYYSKEELSFFLCPFALRRNTGFSQLVEDNYLKAKNAQELADLCGYAQVSFKKLFKDTFGEPVYRWMLRRKAERLKGRLSEEDVNLKEVADEFGFSSPAHFTKFCKKWLGKTPSQYMNELKQGGEQIVL